MTLYNGVDSDTPGSRLPKGTHLLFGYVGATDLSGRPDTPHIWSLDDWNMYMHPDSSLYGGPRLRAIPVYTHDYAGDPVVDAKNATDACRDLGWDMYVGRLLYWDAELLVDEQYTDRLSLEVHNLGMRLGKYGSLSTINRNPPVPGGTWFAQWQDNKPTSIAPQNGVAWQWASPEQVQGAWDLTIADPFVYANAGRNIRRVDA
jgi:hypothetical protein